VGTYPYVMWPHTCYVVPTSFGDRMSFFNDFIHMIYCWFGFHEYEERIWRGSKNNNNERFNITERICIYCKYSPTWER
jgi:hypothetical protein